ncbi:MAG: ABC-type multidrug transport system, permease component [Acidimicrobiaceae bacterium]|nr:ABC-type multidrug transport system, permease component [Acidimicrobiaceae bacterium]
MSIATPTPGALDLEVAAGRRGTPLWWRALNSWAFRWARTWRSGLAANFVYPVVYLAAMGVGLGSLVNRHLGASAASLGGVPYLAFVTPGILAGSVMQIGVHEATYPVLGAIRWDRSYLSQLASPLRVGDLLLGHLAFLAFKALVATSVFLAVAGAFGALESPEAVLALPISVLVALAFFAPIAAYSVTRENDSGFSTIQRMVIVPLFLFSGSFFPIAQLPEGLRVLAVCTPLYHGVALERACTLGRFGLGDLVHIAYLVVLAFIGWMAARRTYQRRLAG